MKNILVLCSFIAFMFGACTPTSNPVTVSLSSTSLTDLGLASSSKNTSFTVTNSSDQEVTFNWERTETQSVTGWTYTINSSTAASGTINIAAGASATISFTINPNGMPGNGTGTISFWDPADQNATTKTFTYDFSTVDNFFTLIPVGSMNRSVVTTDPATDYHIWIKNDNSSSVDVIWAKEGKSGNPTAWDIAVCTDMLCFDPSTFTGSVSISPGDSVDFKLTIDHYGSNLGFGGAFAKFYSEADSTNSYVEQEIIHEVVF